MPRLSSFDAAMRAQARSDLIEELREKRTAAIQGARANLQDAKKKRKSARKMAGGGDGDGGHGCDGDGAEEEEGDSGPGE